MTIPLLTTKLHIPRPRLNLVPSAALRNSICYSEHATTNPWQANHLPGHFYAHSISFIRSSHQSSLILVSFG